MRYLCYGQQKYPILIHISTNFHMQTLVNFAKLNRRKIFFKTEFAKINHAKYAQNSYFVKTNTQKINMLKECWLIQFIVEPVNDKFFHRDMPVFPLILTKTLGECPLIQLSFSYSFFCGTEIQKREIFKNLSFAKISAPKIFKNLPLAKRSTCEIRFFLVHENK